MAKNTELKTEIVITCNAKNADSEIKNIKKSVKALDKEINDLQQKGKGDSPYAKWLRKLRSSLNSFQRETITGAERVQKVVANLGQTSTTELRRARRAAQQFRDSLAANDERFAEANRNLAKIQAQIDKNTGAVNRHGSAWKTTIKNMMAYVGVFGALNMVKGKIEEIISMNNKLSDQMANIRKVSNLPMSDIKELTKNIYKQDTRTNPTEMLDIAYAGAKLGFGNEGIDQLAAFTRSANVVNVALKEDMGPEALTALSKIVENMGLIKSMGVEDAMNKVGSAMFRLSSTSTATSTNIVEFAKRLTAMARVAGITTDQLLALGSASDSMYLAPEVAATAFTKLFSSLQTNHNLIEKTLTIPPGTINSYFQQGKAMDAVLLIFQRMHDMGNMNALKPIFKDLGSDGGARLMYVMTSMAKNVDMLKAHLDTSNEAYKEGTAVLDEYNIQQQTSQALMERANNLWQKTFVNAENVDIVHELAQGWYDLTKSFTSSQVAIAAIHWGVQSLINLLKAVLFLLPSIIMGFGAQGLVLSLTKLWGAISVGTVAVGRLITAFRALSVATKANWIVAVGSAVAFLASKVLEAATSTNKATGFMQGFDKSLRGAGGAIADNVAELESYKRAIESAAVGTERRNLAINNFNKKFKPYLSNLLTEKSTAKDLALAYEEVNKALQKKAYLELRDKDMKQQVVPRAGLERNRAMNYDNAIKGSSSAGFNSAYLRKFYQENKGRSWDDMVYLLNMSMFDTPLNDAVLKNIRYYDNHNGFSSEVPKELANLPKSRNSYYDKKGVKHTGNKTVENAQVRLYLALRYLHAYGSLQNSVSEVDNKYKDLNLDETQKEDFGSLDNKAEDKEAMKAAKKAEAERKKMAREHKKKLQDDLKAADGQVKSFTKAIDAYYTLQEKAIQELYMQGKINEAEMNRYIALMQSKHDIVASQGRFAIVGDENNFGEVRKQMGKGFDQFDYSAESQKLLGIIQKADPTATGKLIRNLEGALGTTPDNSMMNDIRNNGVNNQKSESNRRLKLFQSADSYLNSKNYIENVGRDYDTILSQAGLTDVGLDKGSKEAAGISTKRTRSYVNAKGEVETEVVPEPTESMRMNFVREGTRHYAVDSTSTADLRQWLDRFVSKDGKGVLMTDEKGNKTVNADNMQSWTEYIPEIKNMLLGVGNEVDSKVKFLFSTLMQYEEKYYEAKKQQLDYETKILESRWTRSSDYKEGQTKERELDVKQHVQSIYGRGETGAILNTKEMARNNGFADNIEGDPEVEKARLRMEMARKEALLAQQTSEDKELIRQKDRAAQDAELAYAEKVNSQIKARIDLLQQWVEPLQDFSEAMGEAFVKMTDSAEEGREAMKQATENMVKTFAKMTINMIAQQLKMEVQRALFHKRMQKSEGDYMEGMKDENEKGHKNIFKALGSFFKKKKKDTDKNDKDTKKSQQKSTKEQAGIVEEGKKDELEAVTKTATGKLNIEQKMETQSSQTKEATAASDANTTAVETQGNIFAGIASGAAKIIGKLGWWGIPLIAVIQGLLMGLLSSALGKLFGGKNKSASNTNTKLVSGMLTYDSGNVEAFSGAIDKQTYPVVGNDGKVYAAKPTDQLVTGLLTEPVATTVNGVPSLVAERGPEMIIGRETTQALMMARPDIISEIVKFDRSHSGRTYKAYDSGNVSDVVGDLSVSSVSTPQQQAMQAGLADVVDTMQAMMPAMQAFVRQLQRPLKTSINMYGPGGLYDSMNRANKFMNAK